MFDESFRKNSNANGSKKDAVHAHGERRFDFSLADRKGTRCRGTIESNWGDRSIWICLSFKHPLQPFCATNRRRSFRCLSTHLNTSESSSAKILRFFPGKVTSPILGRQSDRRGSWTNVFLLSLLWLIQRCYARCLKLIVYIYIYVCVLCVYVCNNYHIFFSSSSINSTLTIIIEYFKRI